MKKIPSLLLVHPSHLESVRRVLIWVFQRRRKVVAVVPRVFRLGLTKDLSLCCLTKLYFQHLLYRHPIWITLETTLQLFQIKSVISFALETMEATHSSRLWQWVSIRRRLSLTL
jgi:hypothetical protein